MRDYGKSHSIAENSLKNLEVTRLISYELPQSFERSEAICIIKIIRFFRSLRPEKEFGLMIKSLKNC